MKIVRFKKRIDTRGRLNKHPEIYAVDSNIAKSLWYLSDYEDFMILRSDGYVICSLEEIPELIIKLNPLVAEEVEGITADIKEFISRKIILSAG